jgi:small subunit ribosomal protein S9
LIENEERPGEDEPTPEEEPIEEQPTPEEQQHDEQGAPEEAPPEEALSEDAATEDDSGAEEPSEATVSEETPVPEVPAEAPAGDAQPKKDEVVPGAELDPIAIETERPLDAEERARREAEAEERARRERELIGDGDEEVEQPLAAKPAKLSGDARFLATGKRKSSVARVILMPGNGSIEVNKRKLEEYFPRVYLQSVAKQPLVQSGYEGNVDLRIRVHGGGISGQASAVRHGIARALCEVDPELRKELKRRGMLSRDARVKERRKAGLKKARKKPQFSKR